MRVAILVAMLVAACTSEQSVLGLAQITECMQAFDAPPGTACDFRDVCDRPLVDDPMCCSERADCSPMGLVVARSCNPDCSQCIDDTQCVFGAAICIDNTCTPCPPPGNCAPCPMGWEPLRRNGCETCECAPPSQCRDPETPMGAACAPPDLCYPGARCAPGCAPGDDCCANQCALGGCMAPAPLGCLMRCTDPACMQCVAEDCACTNGTWECVERCIDGEPVSSSCLVP